jgi:hypothetical protein
VACRNDRPCLAQAGHFIYSVGHPSRVVTAGLRLSQTLLLLRRKPLIPLGLVLVCCLRCGHFDPQQAERAALDRRRGRLHGQRLLSAEAHGVSGQRR